MAPLARVGGLGRRMSRFTRLLISRWHVRLRQHRSRPLRRHVVLVVSPALALLMGKQRLSPPRVAIGGLFLSRRISLRFTILRVVRFLVVGTRKVTGPRRLVRRAALLLRVRMSLVSSPWSSAMSVRRRVIWRTCRVRIRLRLLLLRMGSFARMRRMRRR